MKAPELEISRMHTLTRREAEILALIGQGFTTKQIADRLCISCHTVSNHRKHICRKIGVSSTAELASLGARFQSNASAELV